MSRLFALLLVGACSAPPCPPEASAPDVAPEPKRHRPLEGSEPVLRVRLRSLDEAFTSLAVTPAEGAPVALTPATPGPLTLAPYPSFFRVGKESYLGGLEWRDGMLLHTVGLENYLLGVLRGEIALGDVPPAAAAAQAIAARSYALWYWSLDAPAYDVDDTTLFQRYVGLRRARIDDVLRDAVQRTRGRYLAYEGHALKAYFHSTCGGHTTDVRTGLNREESAPLGGVPCEYCSASRHFAWKETIPDATIVKAAGLTGDLTDLVVVERGTGDRVRRVRVVAGGKSREMNGNDFRLAAGPMLLRSTRLTSLRHVGHEFVIEGSGWGHGVGLCQMGAIGLAREGRTADRIVSYYYPGAELLRAY